MHLKHTIQTKVQEIGRGGDGSILHSWEEGDRKFMETYEYHQIGDFRLGLVMVKEITPKPEVRTTA